MRAIVCMIQSPSPYVFEFVQQATAEAVRITPLDDVKRQCNYRPSNTPGKRRIDIFMKQDFYTEVDHQRGHRGASLFVPGNAISVGAGASAKEPIASGMRNSAPPMIQMESIIVRSGSRVLPVRSAIERTAVAWPPPDRNSPVVRHGVHIRGQKQPVVRL